MFITVDKNFKKDMVCNMVQDPSQNNMSIYQQSKYGTLTTKRTHNFIIYCLANIFLYI